MSVIKDLICCKCGEVSADVWVDSVDTVATEVKCSTCKRTTPHYAGATGGLKNRARVMDWPTDPEYYRGQITFGAPEAREGTPDGKPIEYKDGGGVIHTAKKYDAGDRNAIREDKRYHKLHQKRGSTPLFFGPK